MNKRQMGHAMKLAHQIGQQLIYREEWMRKARVERIAGTTSATTQRYVAMARITNRVMIQFQRQLGACQVSA